MTDFSKSHQAAAGNSKYVVQKQSAFSAETIRHPSTAEAAEHAADGEYRHSNRPQMFYELIAHIFVVPILINIFHEIFDIFPGSIDDTSVVAELQHAKHGRKNGIC